MDILIISEFCEDFSQTDNDRFLYLTKMLAGVVGDEADPGDTVELVTSSFYHYAKKSRRKPAYPWPFRITFIEEPGYPRNVCLKRFYSHHIWGKNVVKYLEKRGRKPDVVYCAVPSLTCPDLVAKYCEKNNIRFVIDVQDLWPEAFKMLVNVPVLSDAAFAPFMAVANGIYKRADAICAVSDSYCRRAAKVNKKVTETTTVFLGTDLEIFDRYAAEKPSIGKKDGEIWLGYCGTLGSSYTIPVVIDALDILKDPKIRFIVMGDGPLMEEFREYSESKKVNALFTGRLPYNEMCALLKSCDITVNPIRSSSAATIINKHGDYAASGLPVINTQESVEYRNLIDEYQMGFNCSNDDAEDIARKLKLLADDKETRIRMGAGSRRCAEERFDRKTSYKKLIRAIRSQ